MYATPQKDKPAGSSLHHGNNSTDKLQMTPSPKHKIAEVGAKPKIEIRVPSGMHDIVHNLSPFEKKQYYILKCLIQNREGAVQARSNKPHHPTTSNHQESPAEESNANDNLPNSFNFSLDDDTFVPDAPGTAQFRKSSSVDGINTTFVKDNISATWQFSAGSGDSDSLPHARSQSTNKADRRSPSRSQSTNKAGLRSPIRRRPVATAKTPSFGTQASPELNRL